MNEVYIWDNGEGYSANEVWFIQSDLPRGIVERTLVAVAATQKNRGGNAVEGKEHDHGSLVGVVTEAEWTISPSPLRRVVEREVDYHDGDGRCPCEPDGRSAQDREREPRGDYKSDVEWRVCMLDTCSCPGMAAIREALR